jgi:hypothetical protein
MFLIEKKFSMNKQRIAGGFLLICKTCTMHLQNSWGQKTALAPFSARSKVESHTALVFQTEHQAELSMVHG